MSNELEASIDKCIEIVKSDLSIPIPDAFRDTVSTLQDKGIDPQDIPKFKSVRNRLLRKRNRQL